MMKRLILAFALFAAVSGASAQFRDQIGQDTRVSESILRDDGGGSILFGWFDPSKFQMRHMVSMSYTTLGAGQGFSLGTYTNMMSYRFSENLDAQADVSMSYSPFNSFSAMGKTNDFSGIYLSRAQVNYRPWENVKVQLQYRAVPYGYYYSPFSSPFSYSPWMGQAEF
jgi:hypothetical protein